MKLKHNLLAAAIISTTSVSAMASEVNIYAKALLTLQSSDEGNVSFTEVKSNASGIGFKGTHDLVDGLEVVFKAEFQVDLDGDSDEGDSITDKKIYWSSRCIC